MRKLNLLLYFALILSTITACTKTFELIEPTASDATAFRRSEIAANAAASGSCYQMLEPDIYDDTVHIKTLLGQRLINNPYSVANMQQASRNMYGHANGITTNKKYIRFKPASEAQLEQLVQLNLNLFDYPLDYEVTQQGDYYD